ncbi:MAG TPA: hypothetical protein VMV89_11095 [Candidatus Paceibacterota bacterium]|nr:hypothetical protein [Candidatus Paceibacterota bacterium]
MASIVFHSRFSRLLVKAGALGSSEAAAIASETAASEFVFMPHCRTNDDLKF